MDFCNDLARYGCAVDMWSVGMVFSELLHCACGRLSHLYDEYRLDAESEESSERKSLKFREEKRRAYIEGQIGLVKLNRRYSHPPPSQPLADLPVALDLLDRILRIEWQGEGARLSARDALAHPFFAAKAEELVRQGCVEEQRRFAGVRTRLQQLHEVRCSLSPAIFLTSDSPRVITAGICGAA